MARSPAQDRAWCHNQMLGQTIRMTKGTWSHLQAIIESDTATDDAKQLANEIRAKMGALNHAMRTRKDPS